MNDLKWFAKHFNSEETTETTYYPTRIPPRTLEEAFDKSIEAWALRADGKYIDSSDSKACGLCDLFLRKYGSNDCGGCPIKIETGQDFCNGNILYREWDDYHSPVRANIEMEWLIELKKKYCHLSRPLPPPAPSSPSTNVKVPFE